MAKDKDQNRTSLSDGQSDTFEVGDSIQLKVGPQIYKGSILKTDAKGAMPFVLILTDPLGKTEQEFCRMATSEMIEKIEK